MAYTPVSQRTGAKATGYTPVSNRVVPPPVDTTGINRVFPAPSFGMKTSTQAIPDSNTLGLSPSFPIDLAKTVLQYGLAGGARLGVGLERVLPNIPGIPKSSLPLPLNEKGQYQPTGNAQMAFGDKPIGTVKEYGTQIASSLKEMGVPIPSGELGIYTLGVLGTAIDVSNPLGGGSFKLTKNAAEAIALSKDATKIASIFKSEIPKITDEAANVFGKLLVNVDNADDVQRVINRTNLAIQNAKDATKPDAYTPLASRVAPESTQLGQKILTTGEQKPTIKLKRDITVTTLSGEKVTIPEDEVLKAYEIGGKALLKDGREYIVSKSQYENIKNNSLKSEAKEFAPELKGTEEKVMVENNSKWVGDEFMVDGERVANIIKNEDGTWSYQSDFSDGSETFKGRLEAVKQAEIATIGDIYSNVGTKYSQYQLPGGKNYKEVLIKASSKKKTLDEVAIEKYGRPFKDLSGREQVGVESVFSKQPTEKTVGQWSDNGQPEDYTYIEDRSGNEVPSFRSSHWDEPNVISHLRLNERTYKGKKVTFMEELQSDWARETRKGGNVDQLAEKGIVIDRPTHPLLKNWQELSIKRALKEAVDNNSDYLAWTTGEQQAARYNLSTEINSIEWNKPPAYEGNQRGRNIAIKTKDLEKSQSVSIDATGKIIVGKSEWKGKQLGDVIGKGVAEKILAEPKGNLSGEGLNIGGEWAKNLYDRQVKNIVEDLTGGKVEVLDMGLPIDKANARVWWRDNVKLTENKLKVGEMISRKESVGIRGEEYIITDILGDGKFNAVPKGVYETYAKMAEGQNAGYLESSIKDIKETFDISNKKSTGQQAIKITPRIRAMVGGEAPKFKKGTSSYKGNLTIEEARIEASKFFDSSEMDFIFPTKMIQGENVGMYTPARAYKNPLIQVVQTGGKIDNAVLYHEAFHGYLDRFVSPKERETLLKSVGRNPLTTPARILNKIAGKYTWKQTAEEWVADDFARFIEGKKSLPTNQSFYNKILTKVREWIRKISRLQSVYERILSKERSTINPRNGGISVFKKADKPLSPIEQDLANLKQAIQYTKESVADMPGKQLVKYASRETGALPELGKTTANKGASKSIFAQKGDVIVQDILGQEVSKGGDVAYAQQLLEEYQKAKSQLSKMETGYKQAVKEARSQKIIDAMGIKLEKARQALIEFDKKYPKLLQATQRLSAAEVKGAAVGYKVGQQVERTKILENLRVTQANTASIREQIVNYARENLPLNERGKLITLIRDAKNQKDLTQAFIRIDNKVREIELNKAITTLKDTAEKLSVSPAISADYRNKIKDIIDQYELTGHTNATIAKLEATQAYLDRAVAAGEDTSIPQRILDKLKILSRTPKDQLILSQVQGLQNEIELLGKLGETKWSTKQALYEGEKDLRKQALIDSASELTSAQLPKMTIGEKPSKWAEAWVKTRNYFQKSRIGLTPIEGLADITGMQPMKEALDLSFGNYLVHNAVSDVKWLELTKGFTSKEYERIGAYAISKQSGGIERLANSGITRAEIDAIKLTAEEQRAYQFVRDTFESEYPAVKKYAMDTYNADVGQVENYVSFQSDLNAMSDLEMYDRFGSRADEAISKTKTVEQGFTKERATVAQNKLELNIDKIFRRHTDDVAYMLNMGHDIKQYFEIVNSPEMRAKLGDTGTLAWLQYLDLMARKGGSEGAKRIAALDIIRKNIGAGVLGFRISSALIQFTSFADTVATIGAEAAMRGASRIATSKEWRVFVMDNFPEVKKAIGDDIAFREFGESFMGRLQQTGMTPLQTLDGIMRSTAVAGAYEKLALERGIKIDLAHPDKQLIAEATKSMRQSQGSSFFKDQPLAITAGYGLTDNKSLNKTILTFQSFMLNRWDNIQRQIWRLGIKEGNYGKASMSVFWMIIVAAAMEEGIRRGVRSVVDFATGDSQPEQSFVGNSVLNVVQTVPIAGSLVSSMTYSSNPVPMINAFEEMLSGANSVVSGKAINTKARGAVTALGAGGSLLGIPGSSQAAQLIKKSIPQSSGGSSGGTTKKFKTPAGLPALPSLKLPTPPGLPKLPSI